MKHISELNKSELKNLEDYASTLLMTLTNAIQDNHKICSVCTHKVIILMCQSYLKHVGETGEEIERGTKH